MIFSIKNLRKFWQYYSVWKTFTKILAVLLCMKIYQNSGNDIQYEIIYQNPGNITQYEKFTKILAILFSMKKIYQNPGSITLYENLPKSWQYYSGWKFMKNNGNNNQYENLRKSWQWHSVCKFTKILAMILCMKNLQKSWQWPLVWKIYENPGNDIQYENNLRKSWQWYLIWGVLPAGVFRRLGVLLCTSPRLGYVVLFWDMEFSRAEQNKFGDDFVLHHLVFYEIFWFV